MKKNRLVAVFVGLLRGGLLQAGRSRTPRKRVHFREMCEAASAKLRQAGTDQVVLTMVVDSSGKVQAFTTDSPKGLRLEKMKELATEIKATHFEFAKKDGRPVMVKIRKDFDCSGAMTNPIQPGQ